MKRTTRALRRARDERGLTIVELMVAITIFAIGVLGMAKTSQVTMRQMGDGRRQTIAAAVADSRFERLRSVPCNTVAGGTASSRGVTETWVKTAASRSVIVTDTVKYYSKSFNKAGKTKTLVYRSTIPCPQLP